MRVLLVTQYFCPENFKSNDIAFELSKRGYIIDVLTGIPNYPKGNYFKGYGIFRKRIQNINGINIYRAFLIPRGRGTGFRLGLNYISFVFSASIWAIFLSIIKRYDAIIVHETSPITQGIPAIIIRKLRGTPIYFWVLDLWPESLISAGGVKDKRVISFFEALTRFIYRNSDKILISSRSFTRSIQSKGNFKDKLIYFPNWGDDVFLSRQSHKIPDLPEGFKIVYAGNIGEAQDFESILSAALLLKQHKNIKWVFVGDGRKKQWVNKFITDNNLGETVHLYNGMPLAAMPTLFNRSDLMLLALKNEDVFNLTVPAKLQTYMAASRPVIGMLNGDAAGIIKEAECGSVVNAGDYKALSEAIREISEYDTAYLDKLGQNGKDYYLEHFDKIKCIDNLCKIIGDNIIK